MNENKAFGPLEEIEPDLARQVTPGVRFLVSRKTFADVAKEMSDRKGSQTVTESIAANVSLRAAYNQWTQFSEFPHFMDSVHEVRQLDDTHLHWKANVAGDEKEWNAEITEQIPDKRIAWRGIGGTRNACVVSFHKVSDNCTNITLQMDYDLASVAEQTGDMLDALRKEARSNLKNFKDMVEQRGHGGMAWQATRVTQH
jgi:uncharacterized membrane protein